MVTAIVAIPRSEDYVWRISSEKVPHLTILALDDTIDNLPHVEEFIEHVVKTSLVRFGMDVDRRGVLGDKLADVLFFGRYGVDRLEDFRSYLLTDPNILKAYNAIEQYPKWTPHLTLGYPESPANPDERDYPGITWVNFDRIALWTGDFEGVEFPLEPDDDRALSMSERGKAFMSHYGVKGMKWGVHKSDKAARVISDLSKTGVKDLKSAKEYVRTSPDAKKAASLRVKTRVAGVQTLSNKDLRDIVTRMNLEMQYKNLKKAEFAQSYVGAGAQWAGRFVNDVAKDTAASWLKRPGTNFTGRTSARAYTWGQDVAGAIGQPRVLEIGR